MMVFADFLLPKSAALRSAQDKKDVDFAYWPLNVGPKPGGSDDERLRCMLKPPVGGCCIPLISGTLVGFIVCTGVSPVNGQ